MAALLAILLFGTISTNGQGQIPPPQFPGQGPQIPQPPGGLPNIQPVPAPPPPPPPGYQGIGCPNAADPCPNGQYRYDAITIGTSVYGCFCTCPYTLARDCPATTKVFNWDTCSCENTPPPTTKAPTTAPPTTMAPTTPAPTIRTFSQPGVGVIPGGPLPPVAPYPGQVLPPGPPGQIPPMGGPGPYPVYPGPGGNYPPYPPQGIPQPPVSTQATTWAPGPEPGSLATGAPLDELCGPDPFIVSGFKRVGNFITLEVECKPVISTTSSTSTTAMTTTAASSTATPI